MYQYKLIIDLFTAKEKKKFFILFLLTLITAFIEMLGVASIFPFVALLSNPQLIENNKLFSIMYKESVNLGIKSINDFNFFLGLCFLLFFLISTIFRFITTIYQVKFSTRCESSISKRLLERYLEKPYFWFLSNNNSNLSKKILSDVTQIVNLSILPFLILISQLSLIFFILIMLMFVNFILTISILFFFSVVYLTIYSFTKKLISQHGLASNSSNKYRYSIVSESFEAIKEIKVSGLQKEFIDLYSKFAKIFSKSQFWLEAISRLPRYFIEIVTFSLIMVFILSFIYGNNDISNILSLVTLYIFSAYRTLPAFQNIYVVFSQLKFSKPVLISIHDDLTNFKISKKVFLEPIKFNNNITVKNVNFSFLNSTEPALKDINLVITAFSKIGIVGENGSGKSTLVKIILSLLNPSQGTLSVDNKIINENNCEFWRQTISFVPSKVFISKDTIINNITFGFEKEKINKKLVEDVAEFFNIHNFIKSELRNGYETIIGENGVHLSEGQYQCIGMARALYRRPQVLILDEATNSLDKISEQNIIKKLRNLKHITLIQIAHRVEIFENYDRIFYLEKGKIKDHGNYQQLLNVNKQFLEMTKKFK